jgi:GAF domain-containing protein
MPRLGPTKKKKNSHAAELSQLKKEVQRLTEELESCKRELAEATERETATGEILRVIASSPTEIQPVLDVVAENAAKLCDAVDGVIVRPEGDSLRVLAKYGAVPIAGFLPFSRGFPPGRAVIDRQTIHIHDLQAEIDTEYPDAMVPQQITGLRTVLNTPLLKEAVAVGCIGVRRTEVRPFSEKQIALLKTFADQAVIAIENVRLFKEIQERNSELWEALEHQTATAEVLGIISRSPTDVQPVLDAIVESAARVCGIDDVYLRLRQGDALIASAHIGSIPIGRVEISVDAPQFRWLRDHGTLQIPDVREQNDFFTLGTHANFRTFLIAPLRQAGELIGNLAARRTEVRPFTPAQIKLLETFCDQAVIAIENVRLFNELKESLEQQTATSEILGVIASSPTDIQPVLNTVATNAARLCDATDAQIRLVESDGTRLVASFGTVPAPDFVASNPKNPAVRALFQGQTVHLHDLLVAVESEFPENVALPKRTGTRTFLSTPLLREGTPIGLINVRRKEVRPFNDKQIKLLETFADQAVIAIENVRLFKEIQERNAELREALEHQTATAEVLGIISRSPTDVQPVLDAIVESAARVCRIDDVALRLREANSMVARAHFGPIRIRTDSVSSDDPPVAWVREHGTLHVPDVRAQNDFPAMRSVTHYRTLLAVPLRKRGELIGLLNARRIEVRPFTPAQITLLETFADQAVIAIENVRLFQELQARTSELARSVGELKALGEVGQAVSSTLDLETVLTRIVSHAVQLSGTEGGAIYEYDETSEEFLLRATDHMEEELINALRANPPRLRDGVVGRTAGSREPVQVPNILEERAYGPRMRELLARFGFRASLAVPLLREERIVGALVVRRKSTGEFRPEVVELMKTFATQSVLAIQNARLFREIEDKSRQIEAANRHKSEFLANMSHELRTPLNAIIGFSEVLGERMFGELNEKQAEYTDDILTSGRHLLSLINEILDLSKVEAGRMELEVATFDLPLAIDNARTFVRERATKHGINLDVTVDERLGDFVGDERKIKQILLNLLSNAVKFTPEGGRIGINARQADGSVEISVSDTGIGIPPEDQ